MPRDLNRLQQPAGLVERFLIFAGGHAVGDDARAGLNVGLVALHDERAQRDAGVHVAGVVDVADGAGIGPAAVRLQLVDDLHRPHLRRTADRAGRQAGLRAHRTRRTRRATGRSRST